MITPEELAKETDEHINEAVAVGISFLTNELRNQMRQDGVVKPSYTIEVPVVITQQHYDVCGGLNWKSYKIDGAGALWPLVRQIAAAGWKVDHNLQVSRIPQWLLYVRAAIAPKFDTEKAHWVFKLERR